MVWKREGIRRGRGEKKEGSVSQSHVDGKRGCGWWVWHACVRGWCGRTDTISIASGWSSVVHLRRMTRLGGLMEWSPFSGYLYLAAAASSSSSPSSFGVWASGKPAGSFVGWYSWSVTMMDGFIEWRFGLLLSSLYYYCLPHSFT